MEKLNMAAKPRPSTTPKPKPSGRKLPSRMALGEVMSALEKAGSAQARKTYTRHGATEPMFGVSFAFLKILLQKIRVDQELALALWNTRNFDARNLAVKIADPLLMSPTDLDRWASEPTMRGCHAYVASLAAEGPHGRSRAAAWLKSKSEAQRSCGWLLVAALASRDEGLASDWVAPHLATVEKSIHTAPNREREAMNGALIALGCRDGAARKAALAAAKRIGPVTVDHGDTDCKTPSAAAAIEKAWAHAAAKGFENPAAQERGRESMRTRC
jgi:3-methyladenine DNA glycosylase AlkD